MADNRTNNKKKSIEDFQDFFNGSKRLLGNSAEYEEIKDLVNALREMEAKPISHDMAYERSALLARIAEAGRNYQASHVSPRTSTGRDRLSMVGELMEYCAQEKKAMDSPAVVRYFDGAQLQKMRAGVDIKNVYDMQTSIQQMKKETMTEDGVINRTNEMNQLILACDAYLDMNPEGEYRENLTAIRDEYKSFIDQTRDMRTVRRLIEQNKGWDDLEALRESKAVVNGHVDVVGANVSQRLKITHEGKIGFFTQQTHVMGYVALIEKYIADNRMNDLGRIIDANKTIFGSYNVVSDFPSSLEERTKRYLDVGKMWNKMPDSPKKDALKTLLADEQGEVNLDRVMTTYKQKLQELSPNDRGDLAKKQALFANSLLDIGLEPEKAVHYIHNADILMDYVEHEPAKREWRGIQPLVGRIEHDLLKSMVSQDLKTPEGLATYQARKEMLDNPKAVVDAVALWRTGRSLSIAESNGRFDEKDQVELTNRNVATSRLAELLGIGNLVAHSEKMTVQVNGKEMTGCFMEFADGIDLHSTKDMNQLRVASQARAQSGGMHARDASNLELFDIICAQMDRHAGNFFTKVGELEEDGKRSLTGLQGIDNDIAFGRMLDPDKRNRGGALEGTIFVDKQFAENLGQLTREKVEYAVGDLLNGSEIDAIMARVERVKEHINTNAITLQGSEWNLDRYKVTDEPEDDYGKRYVKGLKSIKESVEGKYVWDEEKHKEGQSIHNVHAASERYQKMIREEEEQFSGIRELFEEAEKSVEKTAAPEKDEAALRAERAAKFDAIMQNKSAEKSGSATSSYRAQTAPEQSRGTQRMSFKDFAGRGQFARSARFADERAKEAQKQAEKTNRPVIGGHHGPKK